MTTTIPATKTPVIQPVAAAVCAFLFMNNLTEAKADVKPVWESLRHRDTWIMSLRYIGTCGSFIGYSAAFPTLLKTVFGRGDIALTWAFLGAGFGSVIRPLGGRRADRIGGARITVVSTASRPGSSAHTLSKGCSRR